MELFTIPIGPEEDDHVIIYRPLLNLAFIGNRAMGDLAQKYAFSVPSLQELTDSPALTYLMNIGFFMPDITPNQPDNDPTSAVLLLTNQCQLRCTYCYANAGVQKPKKLSLNSGLSVIDNVCKRAEELGQNTFKVDFHGGGEPSLEWGLLCALTDHARAKEIKAQVSMTSNAIWSDAQCEWIINNLDNVSISMDGSPRTQDHQRPLAKHPTRDRSSSEIVLKNLKKLDEHEFPYGIRMTVIEPWSQLVSDVEFIIENTKCRSMQVEPAFNIQRGDHEIPNGADHRGFAEAFNNAFEFAREKGAHLSYSGARPGIVTRVFCSAPHNALVLNPEDQLVACYEVTNNEHSMINIANFGSAEDGKIKIDTAARENFYRLQTERLELICDTCYCKWSCAGDCFTRAYGPSEGGHLDQNLRCDLNRDLTRDMLLRFIWENDGVWGPMGTIEKN